MLFSGATLEAEAAEGLAGARERASRRIAGAKMIATIASAKRRNAATDTATKIGKRFPRCADDAISSLVR